MEFLPQLREDGVYRLVNTDAGEESSPVSNSCCAQAPCSLFACEIFRPPHQGLEGGLGGGG